MPTSVSVIGTGVRQFFRGLLASLLAVAVTGCGWSGPSDHFLSLDTNGDGSLDLEEWMAYYGPHDHAWESCSGHDFEPADCDNDLVLTWSEYHSARFKSDFCGDPQAHLTIYRKPELDPARGRYVTLPPACRLDFSGLAQRPQAAIAGPGTTRSICEMYGSSVED